jgi:hypothetical protein
MRVKRKSPLLFTLALGASLSGYACRERVDPGNVGVLLDDVGSGP